MTTNIRYKFVNNLTANPYDINTFPAQTDGDDRQYKIVRRVLGVNDVGAAVGRTRSELGAIVDVIPLSYNVLWVSGLIYRPSAAPIVGTVRGYEMIDNKYFGGFDINVLYAVNSDNTIRVIDNSPNAAAYIAVGDVVVCTICFGAAVDPNDLINY